MTTERLIAFLQAQRFGTISTVGASGEPQAAVVGFAFSDEGEAIFDTLNTTHKAHNVRRDARAALVVWEGPRTVQIEGLVDEPVGAEKERLLAIYFAAFPDGKERLGWHGIAHFRVRPTWVRYSDFSGAGGPLVVEWTEGLG